MIELPPIIQKHKIFFSWIYISFLILIVVLVFLFHLAEVPTINIFTILGSLVITIAVLIPTNILSFGLIIFLGWGLVKCVRVIRNNKKS